MAESRRWREEETREKRRRTSKKKEKLKGEEAEGMRRDVARKPLRRDRRCSLCAVSLARVEPRRRAREREEGKTLTSSSVLSIDEAKVTV